MKVVAANTAAAVLMMSFLSIEMLPCRLSEPRHASCPQDVKTMRCEVGLNNFDGKNCTWSAAFPGCRASTLKDLAALGRAVAGVGGLGPTLTLAGVLSL